MKVTRRLVGAVVGAVAVVGIVPFLVGATSGGQASTREALACGSSVTASVTLTADITGCAGVGLSVGKASIVINLNGHTISGSSSSGQGIADLSFSGITVENGTITGFGRGIELDGSASVHAMRIFGNSQPGIVSFGPVTITNSVLWQNAGGGIYVGCCGAGKATISSNIVESNTGTGIFIPNTTAASVVTANHVLNNTGTGIDIGAAGTTVTGNIANGNGADGIVLNDSGALPASRAASNKANDNGALGISLGGGDTDGGANTAVGNATAAQCVNVVC